MRLFFAECIVAEPIDLRKADQVLSFLPKAHVITDCKSLYDALEKSESAGLGLAEKRTAIEVTATRETMRETGLPRDGSTPIDKWLMYSRSLMLQVTVYKHYNPLANGRLYSMITSQVRRNYVKPLAIRT